MALTANWISTHRDMRHLKDEWEALQDKSDAYSPYLSWTWITTYWAFLCHPQNAEMWLLTLREPTDNRLVAIAPLQIIPQQPHDKVNLRLRQLMFIGSNFPIDHFDFIVERGYEEQAVKQILDQVWERRDQWDVLALNNILPDSPNVPHIRNYTDISWEETDGHIVPYAELPADWDTYYQDHLSKRKRKNVRRRHRLVEGTFGDNWSFKVVAEVQLIEPTLNEMMRLHQLKWEALGEPGAFHDPLINEFYTMIARRFFDRGWLRLCHLTLGDQTAAISLLFAYRGRFYGFSQGLDDDLLEYSPGNILQEWELRTAMSEQIQEFDFGWGDSAYKYKWGASDRTDRIFTYHHSTRAKFIRGAIDLARQTRTRVEEIRTDDETGQEENSD